MKTLIMIALLAVLATSFHVREQHDYWYTAAKKTAESGVAFADVAWNYCDYKCATLETYYPGVDFYVIKFKGPVYKPDFAACYAKTAGGNPQLWNKVAKNTWYETNCGDDTEDYLTNPKYTKESEDGVGLGTPITPY